MKVIIFLFITFILAQEDCADNRYLDSIFNVEVTYDVQFGENINQTLLGTDYLEELYMDIYQPVNDSNENRPLIFFMFGGSFVSGSKSAYDIVSLCNDYASRGYVAVAIDYRLSTGALLFSPNEETAYKAVMKGIHDLKSAIRYFRMNDSLYDDYRIDSNRIFAGGVSAGAIVAVNAAYLNEETEIPAFLLDDLDDIGGIEGLSGNEGYDSSFSGIVNLCGAVGEYDWIKVDDVPIVSMHGNADTTVPYADNLVTLFGLNIQVYGSYTIHETMLNLDNYSALYTYEGGGHIPFSDLEFESDFTSSFLYELVCADDTLGDINLDGSIDVLDIISLINFILLVDIPNTSQFEVSDINNDEFLNILDIVSLVEIILNQ